MKTEERKQKLDRQTNELYASLGQFTVKFEHVCFAIENCIVAILGHEGLHSQKVARILLAGITADPLRALFQSLYAEINKDQATDEVKIIKDILARFQKLTQDRNNIVHGKWFIGWASEQDTDFSKANGIKLDKNSSGFNPKNFPYTLDDFNNFIKEAEELGKIFQRLHGCIFIQTSVAKNFSMDKTGRVLCEEK